MVQELPPSGGFSSVRFKRYLPKVGPPLWTLFIFITVAEYWGQRMLEKQSRLWRELDREALQGNFYLQPLLMAENERDLMRKMVRDFRIERDAMKGFDNWTVGKSTYYTKNYMQKVTMKGHIDFGDDY